MKPLPRDGEVIIIIKNGYVEKWELVRHGKWEHLGGDEWFCSACGHVITTEGSWERPWQKYCEECGAKMEGEQNG